MGEHDVGEELDDRQLRAFTKALLDDVRALERMLEDESLFDVGERRIGAEQEMFLVDDHGYPASRAMQVLEDIDDDRLTTELARFNLEANLSPRVFGGRCLGDMERELREILGRVIEAAARSDTGVVLTGILPTLRKSDLGLDNMTPHPRYHALNRAMSRLRGGDFHVLIKGLDELETTHDNVMLESCNTSFQVHFQVAPSEFAKLYNVAQAIAAPVLAAAVNSPLLLGRRLWSETRVALFQRSVDTRSTAHAARGLPTRVSFGDDWIRESVLEIFREDIARARVLLASDKGEKPLEMLDRGEAPLLHALRLHNGTVYRWNRACYGVADGIAHLRIENRVLPAGPTIVDELANAAFFFGLMSGVVEEHGDVASDMRFDDAKRNFFAAARQGLDAQLTWMDEPVKPAAELILDPLIPLARAGLARAGIDAGDIDRYLGVLEDRVRSGRTGARWMVESFAAMGDRATNDTRCRTLTEAMRTHQVDGCPVHEWELRGLDSEDDWRRGYRTVGQFMSTDLFTVRPEDLVDLAASMMDWEHVRHVPVEDDQGRLVGLVSHRALLRLVARGMGQHGDEPVAVSKIMKTGLVTVRPETPTLEAMQLMRERRVTCLPVVENERLVGIVTDHDLVDVAADLLEKHLREDS